MTTTDTLDKIFTDYGTELLLLQDQPLDAKYDKKEKELKETYCKLTQSLLHKIEREAYEKGFKDGVHERAGGSGGAGSPPPITESDTNWFKGDGEYKFVKGDTDE